MKNFWVRQRMTRAVYYRCSDKGRDLSLYRLFSINWIIAKGYLERYAFRRSVRTSVKVKYEISLDMMQILGFGLAIRKNMPSLSKRAIIPLRKDRWNFSSYCILNSLAWRCLTNPYYAPPS